eukprot:CAMPEP_0201931818 /NCGR_PEP_ID=MMETSP0903-20130614/28182_1 /ASSEMBLY_ACC=CAM_ASM_000552 /TAXON_ID=420261 /ORGANISM="Thalassiosira antarctica, Strain CCMP982" /LENGTH=262 /DNA_ID=CAMNT_0048471247 /DNA_START=6 /DNA_END=794 /DNA_ORIENTATION=+
MSECIYKFVEQPQPKKPKKQIYRSKYDPNGPIIGSTFGMQGTTAVDGKGCIALKKNHVVSTSFGVQPQPPNPKQFLRRGTRQCRDGSRIPSVEHRNRNKDAHKPAVPLRNDNPVQGLKTSKNYLNCNAVEAIDSAPKKRKETEVPHIAREDYGQVPAYLQTVKAEIEHEKELVDMYVEEQYGPVKGSHQEHEVMDEQERRELINNLKQRWGDVNADYQKYCHKVNFDTPGERKRKASQEAELKQLEEYIEKLSCPGPLVIKK